MSRVCRWGPGRKRAAGGVPAAPQAADGAPRDAAERRRDRTIPVTGVSVGKDRGPTEGHHRLISLVLFLLP